MKKDASYLRCAYAAFLLAIAAYAVASVTAKAQAPETVTAVRVTVSETVSAEGSIRRDEYILPQSAGDCDIPHGERISAGTVLGSGFAAPCAGFFTGDRIVSGGWCFEFYTDDLKPFYIGRQLTVKLGSGEYPGVVTNVTAERVCVRCREGLCDVLYVDSIEAQLILCDITGIKIPPDAVKRGGDGEYVYILRAGRPSKRTVHIIYEDSGLCLADAGDLEAGSKIVVG